MSSASSGQYRLVAKQIRERIASGRYPRGEALPKEFDLAEELHVNRVTVNRAIRILVSEGLVRIHRGKGSFVNEIPVISRHAMTRQSAQVRADGQARGAFDGEIRRLGLEPRSDLARVGPELVPAEAGALLGLPEGASALARVREMYANDVPVQLAVSYLPLDIADGTQIAERDTGPGGLYSRLADLGHAPHTFTETVTVRPPSEEEARFLRMDPDQRVIVIARTATDAAGRAVEVCLHVMPAHQWSLTYQWSAELEPVPPRSPHV